LDITQDFRFTPDRLNVENRMPGVSAFMRIRNGAFSLEAAIRSHIGHFDEIVALYNRCTDETPEILHRLACEYGPKLRVFHYLPEVFPPGSDGHRTEPPDSPRSLVAYYNCALSLTRFSHATKLDDDHLAMDDALATLLSDVKRGRAARRNLACYSGLNLSRDRSGRLGILAREPFSGSGDISVFPVQPTTYFVHDPRFERFQHPGLRPTFHSFTYWHLKYLKPDMGFANYDLVLNPKSRYARRQKRLLAGQAVVSPNDLDALHPFATLYNRIATSAGPLLPARYGVLAARNAAFHDSVVSRAQDDLWRSLDHSALFQRLMMPVSETEAVV
jgi:hypothetical protein